jgi:bifunctional DNase/RNase
VAKIKLNVLGLTQGQSQIGTYALILTEEEGTKRLPIIIGGFEAQAIAIIIENLKPPRPLTHDLFMNTLLKFNVTIEEAYIYKLEEGVFYSKIIMIGPDGTQEIESRTSDAIALALRFNAPIYTDDDILEIAGVDLTEEEQEVQNVEQTDPKNIYKYKSEEQLQNLLTQAIEEERYEDASKIRDEINSRK